MTATLPRMLFRGAWSSSTPYASQDVVTSSGQTFVAISANTNSLPPSGNWVLLGGSSSSGSGNRSFFMS